MTDPRSIAPNNGKAPKTLVGCLSLAVQVLEGVENDYPNALECLRIADAKRMLLDALHANEYEEAEMRLAGLDERGDGFTDPRDEAEAQREADERAGA